MNGDGRVDVVTAGGGYGNASVLLGNGAGGFNVRTDYPAGTLAIMPALGDLNGDGRTDIVMANTGVHSISVLLGKSLTRTALTVTPSLALTGTATMLKASVTVPSLGSATAADSVQFFDGTTFLGTAPVVNGLASFGTFSPYLGDRALSAVYKGDPRLTGSVAFAARQRVVGNAAAALATIADVKNDRGGTVRLTFGRSAFDYLGSPTAVTGYQVYRRAIVSGAARVVQADPLGVQLAGWDYVTTVPATTEDTYQATVPTFADSNASGVHRAVLFVRAATATPGVFFDSAADSGYSVDNLPPIPPAPFAAAAVAGSTDLHWRASGEDDLWYHRVYRGNAAGFTPGPGNLVATTADTAWVDAGTTGAHYKLSAVDVNGNESGFTTLGPGQTLDAPAGSVRFALEPPANPSLGGRVSVRFSLATDAPARLDLIDVSGRRVATRAIADAGAHVAELGDAHVRPGVYFVRLAQGARSASARVMILQ